MAVSIASTKASVPKRTTSVTGNPVLVLMELILFKASDSFNPVVFKATPTHLAFAMSHKR